VEGSSPLSACLVRLDLLALRRLGLLEKRRGEADGHQHEEEDGEKQKVVQRDVGQVMLGLAKGQPAVLIDDAVVVHQAVVEP